MRTIDWSRTAVGPVETWPQSLRTALSILLETGFAMYIAWGKDFTQFYNDGYRPILGSTKHPAAMGISTRETFAEIWHIIGPMFEGVMRGTPVTVRDFLLPLDRHGFVEECYFDFSYSPIREESGVVGGVLVTVSETTERLLAARRLETLCALAARTQKAESTRAACALAIDALAESADLPFALIYLFDESRQRAELACATSKVAGSSLAPTILDVTSAGCTWPAGEVSRGGARVVEIPFKKGDPDDPRPARAFVLPVRTPGDEHASGVLVAALSPRLLFDDAYKSFLTLVSGQIGSAIASARTLEEAKARAAALAALDRAKTAFFSDVSHELRTPLTLILGPAEDALRTGGLPEKERKRWAIVHRNALRLWKLVNTLLDFARIEAGRVDACFEPVDLAAFTGDLASMFRSAIERAGLTLRLDLQPLREPAYVDREMWEKIVLNLLSNALKFTFDGEIEVALHEAGEHVELRVRDTGVGIPRSELHRVFERFYRIRGGRARTHEGTGIGLALVAELTRLHGGRAHVESREGTGTTFSVILPRGHAHLPRERIGAARSPVSTSTGAAPYVEEALRWTTARALKRELPPAIPEASRPRIVVADDNADMREYVERLLGDRWDVETFVDGAEALAAVQRRPPDLVVTDVMMPKLDGFGLLRAIREDPRLRALPVILLSARAGEEATAEGLAAGANDYVVKPFAARELQSRVASALSTARTVREAQAIEAGIRTRLYEHFLHAPFPLVVLRGPQHVVELANREVLAAWRKTPDVLGKPLVEALPELEGQPFLGYLDEVFRTGNVHERRAERSFLARGAGGELVDVYWDYVYSPLRKDDGTVDGILVVAFEVTAQVQAQKEQQKLLAELAAQERHFRELVENLPELAWTARPDGYIDYFNRAWFEYTGKTFDELRGKGVGAAVDPEHLEDARARWERCLVTGETFEAELPLRGADGVHRWFLSRMRPLRDDQGRIVRWFGMNTNIDDRRRHEAFRETFLGILGHDLRNPLNTILVTARVLAMRADTPAPIRQRLERMISSGTRMQRMIEQLLDLTRARLDRGIPVARTERPIDLAPLVRRIVDEIREATPGRPIDVTVEGTPAAHVDPDRFEQVVSNLVGNAVTHGDPARGAHVLLAEDAEEVRLVVDNSGQPIDPAFLRVVFNPFARAEKPRGPSAGLGLGLYITERIVHAHGGTIAVTSDERSTRFEVVLPVKEPS